MISRVTKFSIDSDTNKNLNDQDENSITGNSRFMIDALEETLWNRKLGVISEEIVATLVCQIFEGIRDHIIQNSLLKFNCFLLMAIVDKLPHQLREKFESLS